MCHDIASPSLSGSVARYNVSAFFIASFNFLTTFLLSAETSYVVLKLSSISRPRFFDDKSRIWPTDASI